jgi:capsular polysaccharide biosynthesis protein
MEEHNVGTESLTEPETTIEDRVVSPPAPAREKAPPQPASGVWGAVRAHWIVVLLSIVIFTGGGVAAAVHRHPNYSATARAAVQHFNANAPGALGGFATAAPALADTYARSIDADGVVNPLAKQFHVTAKKIRSEVSAVEVPQSAVFTVTATTQGPNSAVALANAALQAILNYEQGVNSTNPNSGPLHDQLVKAEDALSSAITAKNDVIAGADAANAIAHKTSQTNAQRAAIGKAQAAQNVAQDEVNVLRTAYQQSFLSTTSKQYIQALQTALQSTSDKLSRVALYGFAGLVVGIAVGVGLALLLNARRARRADRFVTA